MHHKKAEQGIITREELLKMIKEKWPPPPGSPHHKNKFFSPPTAHSNSHNFKFSVSFLENRLFDIDEIIGSAWAFFSAIKKHCRILIFDYFKI